MAKNQIMVRTVWLLPARLVDQIIDYQEEKLILTEVAAVRELLDLGLKTKGF